MSLRLLADITGLSKKLKEMQEHYDKEIAALKKEIDALKPRKPGRPKREETK